MCGRFLRDGRIVSVGAILLGAAMLAGVSGCSSDPAEGGKDNPRASASGSVTFNGQPIPAGSVTFTHLDSGTYSTCPIDDGTYENESGDGPLIGKNVVTVVGLEAAGGKPQWSGAWSKEVDIAGDTFEQNFEVQSDEVKPYKDLNQPGEVDEDAPLY
jgi:hypothetical protein